MVDVMIAWFAASLVFGLGWALSARMAWSAGLVGPALHEGGVPQPNASHPLSAGLASCSGFREHGRDLVRPQWRIVLMCQ